MTLRAKRLAALRTRLHAGHMLLNLRGHDLLLQACKQRFALCYSQSHASRRDFLPPLDHPHLVFDGAAWDRLKYQLDCPFHPQRLTQPTTLHTLKSKGFGSFASAQRDSQCSAVVIHPPGLPRQLYVQRVIALVPLDLRVRAEDGHVLNLAWSRLARQSQRGNLHIPVRPSEADRIDHVIGLVARKAKILASQSLDACALE